MQILSVFMIVLGLALSGSGPAQAQSGIRDESMAARAAINTLRAQNGRAALQVSKALAKAASAHANDMVRKGFFSHKSSNGATVGSRARAQGYGYCLISENIGKGYTSTSGALKGWMGSAAHRANILHRSATEYGLASGAGGIWVMVLGRPGC